MKFNRNEEIAFNHGFKVVNGVVYSPKNTIRATNYTDDGYERFTINNDGKLLQVKVHRLVAYQKYGDKLYSQGIEVRHLDTDSTNNLDDNIDLGTSQQNRLDVPEDIRIQSSVTASTKVRKFTDKEIFEIRDYHSNCKSYKETMKKYDITSKGTLHYILNNKYKTKR